MKNKICSKTVLDSSVPGILFDEFGVANYCGIYDQLDSKYPKGEKGLFDWNKLINKIKKEGKNKKYDVIVGLSGGTDSCFLLHLAKKNGLRPLAVNLDNGWNTAIAVKNIIKMTNALGVDLKTYVINYEEVIDILKCYMKAGLPWIDGPTDRLFLQLYIKLPQKKE